MFRPEYFKQKAEEEASRYLETHGFPDPYDFEIDGLGRIISPNTKRPIEEYIDTKTHLGQIEYQAFKEIQDKVKIEDEGIFVWVSPPCISSYKSDLRPTAKAVITLIVSDELGKRLVNRSVITEWDNLGSVVAANEFSKISTDRFCYLDETQVRRKPIFIDSNKTEDFLLVLGKMLDEKSMRMILNGEDIVEKYKFMNEYMRNGRGLPLGSGPESCPTAFEAFFGKTFDCPNCGYKIPSGRGITRCPGCYITKEEYAKRTASVVCA